MLLRFSMRFCGFSTILKLSEKFIELQKKSIGGEILIPGRVQVHNELLYPGLIIHKFFITLMKRLVENSFIRARGIKRINIIIIFIIIWVRCVLLFCHLGYLLSYYLG